MKASVQQPNQQGKATHKTPNSPEAGVMSTVTVVTSACNVSSEERSEESIVIHRADFWRKYATLQLSA
ncbi:hypothetical protein J6590_090782, partial [Homalodisca vitripennis]